jgi:hypothetical protein
VSYQATLLIGGTPLFCKFVISYTRISLPLCTDTPCLPTLKCFRCVEWQGLNQGLIWTSHLGPGSGCSILRPNKAGPPYCHLIDPVGETKQIVLYVTAKILLDVLSPPLEMTRERLVKFVMRTRDALITIVKGRGACTQQPLIAFRPGTSPRESCDHKDQPAFHA